MLNASSSGSNETCMTHAAVNASRCSLCAAPTTYTPTERRRKSASISFTPPPPRSATRGRYWFAAQTSRSAARFLDDRLQVGIGGLPELDQLEGVAGGFLRLAFGFIKLGEALVGRRQKPAVDL